jgi:hypothetical protein
MPHRSLLARIGYPPPAPINAARIPRLTAPCRKFTFEVGASTSRLCLWIRAGEFFSPGRRPFWYPFQRAIACNVRRRGWQTSQPRQPRICNLQVLLTPQVSESLSLRHCKINKLREPPVAPEADQREARETYELPLFFSFSARPRMFRKLREWSRESLPSFRHESQRSSGPCFIRSARPCGEPPHHSFTQSPRQMILAQSQCNKEVESPR